LRSRRGPPPLTSRNGSDVGLFIIRMINRGRLSDQVVDHLQSLILSSKFAPQDRLPTETELGSELGVSRTVVRDAIRTLSAKGLVRVRQGHGMEVSAPNEERFAEALFLTLLRSDLTIDDVLSARSVLETEVGPIAAERAQEEDWDHLSHHLAVFRQAVEGARWPEASRAHLGFHLALLKSTRLPALELLLRPMQHVILLSSWPPDVNDPNLWEVDAHAAILTALRSRQRDAVHQALRSHYQVMEGSAYSSQRATRIRDVPEARDMLGEMIRDGSAVTRKLGRRTSGRTRQVKLQEVRGSDV
jgi:GntR family transcriptional regulator, transcriptional repressor for pyruvate dehydrogenase complex